METLAFKDYQGRLEGMYVLLTIGTTYGGTNRNIVKIARETKTSFKIATLDKLYDKNTGYARGLNSKANIGTMNYCELLSTNVAIETIRKWQEKKLESSRVRKHKNDIDALFNDSNFSSSQMFAIYKNMLEIKSNDVQKLSWTGAEIEKLLHIALATGSAYGDRLNQKIASSWVNDALSGDRF